MVMDDFIFNDKRLSEYGFIVCNFDDSTGFTNIDGVSNMKFNYFTRNNGRSSGLSHISYEDNLELEFDICKNPSNGRGEYLSPIDFNNIMQWLNTENIGWLEVQYDDNWVVDPHKDENGNVFCVHGGFSMEVVEHRGRPVGFSLKFSTDSPFTFGKELYFSGTVNPGSPLKFKLPYNMNRISYPVVSSTQTAAGPLTLTIDSDGFTQSIIKNCIANETITIDSFNQIISTNKSHSTLYDDFNYIFPKIKLNDSCTLSVASSISTYIAITFRPIINLIS